MIRVGTNDMLVPVEGDVSDLPLLTRVIHNWLIEQHKLTGAPVKAGRVVVHWGKPHKWLRSSFVLPGNHLETLVDASLIYIDETAPK